MNADFPAGWSGSYPGPMLLLSAVLAGLVVGSFLNVCIHRVPHKLSIVRPRSCCPHCSAPVLPRDNVPLLSYALLGGRCRACREPIGARYPFVELLTALLFAALVLHFGLSPQLVGPTVLTCALITVTFIDLDHQIIPDVISLPGIVVGFLLALGGLGPTWGDSLAGLLLGGGFLWAVAEGYYRATGREGMGGGDIKLLAMIGAFLGWKSVLLVLMVASVTGSIAGGMIMLLRGVDSKVPIPFGPFLAAGALIALFSGDQIVDWYVGNFYP